MATNHIYVYDDNIRIYGKFLVSDMRGKEAGDMSTKKSFGPQTNVLVELVSSILSENADTGATVRFLTDKVREVHPATPVKRVRFALGLLKKTGGATSVQNESGYGPTTWFAASADVVPDQPQELGDQNG